MKIIPFGKLELSTNLSIEEVRKTLNDNIRPKQGIMFRFNKPKNDKLFEGVFEQDYFEIQRIILGRKSFIPQITGRIKPSLTGTKLYADLKVRKTSIVFVSFWIVFVAFTFAMGIIGVINQGTNPILLIFPLIMIMFVIGLVHYVFNNQKEKSINDLKRILNGQIK